MLERDTGDRVQRFEWGTISWFIDPGNLDTGRLSVGIVCFDAYAVEEEHIHANNEQVIYAMGGTGVQFINGVEYDLNPGDIRHIPPFSRHKVINRSATELKILIVYSPARFQVEPDPETCLSAGGPVNIRNFTDYTVVQGLLNKLAKSVDLSLALLDSNGNLLIKTDNYPRFCRIAKEESANSHCRARFQRAACETAAARKPYLFECCSGITGIIMPLHSGQEVNGYVVYGQVFLNRPDLNAMRPELSILAENYTMSPADLFDLYQQIPLVPKNRLYSAAEAILLVANYITDMVLELQRRQELDNSRLSLLQEQRDKANLEKALREADFKLLQSQIQPHFLFNTLSMIAQMAYIDGADKVASLVWSLADLLKFTLRKSEKLVSLAEELKILKSYLHIQLSRFSDRLGIELDIQSDLDDCFIPCMLLQPLVENAIIHGFNETMEGGLIRIVIRRDETYLHCSVTDNGSGFDSGDWLASAEDCSHIGLNSVKNRLCYYFKDDHQFEIHSRPMQGTRIELVFPATGGSGYA